MAVVVSVPASKSVTQRALVLAALSPGVSVLEEPAESDDVALLVDALAALGVPIHRRGLELHVEGGAPLRAPAASLHLGNAGTATRLLAGLSLLVEGPMVLDGVEAMRHRPMGGLLGALRRLGVAVDELGLPGCPPVRLERRAEAPGRVELDTRGSSQQVSALLVAATGLPRGLALDLTERPPSRPYVELTLEAIRAFGGRAAWTGPRSLLVEPCSLEARRLVVEGDWSSAAMVLAGAWILGREVTIPNLPASSRQGDRVFVEVLERLDAEGPREIDLGDAPDLVPPTVAAALFASGPTRLTGIGHLRVKESDRIAVLAGELAKVGARIEPEAEAMTVRPGALAGPAVLDPHGDHRMAMAFGLVGLRVRGLEVSDRGCVSKSFPGFWDALEALR